MIDLTPLFQALIALGATAITVYAIPYIKSKTSNDKLERMKAWAEIGVKAAEQIYDGPGNGTAKKAYVLDFLTKHGYTVDFGELEALIESTVNNMKSEQSFLIEGEVESDV